MTKAILNLSKVSDRAKDTLEKYEYTIVDGVNEVRFDGSTNYHLWVEVVVNGKPKLYNIQSDFDVFYDSNGEKMRADIHRIKANNKYWTQRLKEEAAEKADSDKLDQWLKTMFGDDLPARKTIATIRKYLSDDVLKEYANGKKGIDGVRADNAFFATKAYRKFYNAVK